MQTTEKAIPIDEALKIVTPSWPLQNTVAVNPFWFLRSNHFCDVVSELELSLHQRLLMTFDYYEEKYSMGEITLESLSEALSQARLRWDCLPNSINELSKMIPTNNLLLRCVKSIAEITPHPLDLKELVIGEISKFSSAYFDRHQALVTYTKSKQGFWCEWIDSTKFDRTMDIAGFPKFAELTQTFFALNARQALEHILKTLGLTDNLACYLYIQRLAAMVNGWGSHFRYNEWQTNLGYAAEGASNIEELIAVLAVYDYVIFKHKITSHEALYQQWADALNHEDPAFEKQSDIAGLHYTWQLALELSYQKNIAARLNKTQPCRDATPKYQLVFCIDVRSEMIRRHIEGQGAEFATIGFAGFFSAAIDYRKIDEHSVGHRLPVLLKPAIVLNETTRSADSEKVIDKVLTNRAMSSYFRNLRKAPLSSLLFVELFGILSVGSFLRRYLISLYLKMRGKGRLSRFDTSLLRPEIEHAKTCDSHHNLTIEEKIQFAVNALKHMGLKTEFAKIVTIVGHGSQTTNNAFESALDCGACGGHPGDINARFLTSLLNDVQVRQGLRSKGFAIPTETLFVAALHETVTDEILFFDEHEYSQHQTADLIELKRKLKVASTHCSLERQTARSTCLDTSAAKRSENWSEVRPEWGLSGNACFVVAPRWRTSGINLSSRAFLHDYNWRSDEDFSSLELIMTAPMIVTNWINLQYYGSVVAPRYFGSGNKVLHNLINECGVVEGNGGDLRVGLPIQSVHDGRRFVHDPLRLSVFIEAPQNEIERIISKHRTVKELVENEWLHLVHIDSETNCVSRRLSHGVYTKLT